ncbi:hypothetical protein [Stenotrophomonas pavanii]|uniref:DUF7210 family protein n=1 Tax=Stenotrophomonas pavanii TaxID=487698 RepID=UPI0039C70AD7
MHIELLKPHTHASQRRDVGERLDLADTSARWLIAQGAAKATTPATDLKPSRRDVTSGTANISQGD